MCLGLVLGSFFYGYWVLQIPGAWLALKIGGTRVFGYGVLLTSLLAILTPIAARYHVMALIGVRIFQGLFLVSYDIGVNKVISAVRNIYLVLSKPKIIRAVINGNTRCQLSE